MQLKEKQKEKQKENSPFFDFYKKTKIKQKTTFKKNLTQGFYIFMGIQLIFGACNLFRAQNYIDDQIVKGETIVNDYGTMIKAMRSGDQNKSIELFSKIKYQNSAIADLLIGGTVTTINLPVDNEHPNEYLYKLTPQTLGTINYIYENNWNSGVLAQKKVVNDMSCFLGDFTCYISRPLIQHKMTEYSDMIYKKVQASHYNATHIEEFVTWQKGYIERAKSGKFLTDERTPGQKHVEPLK